MIDFVPWTSYIGAGIEENGDLCLVAVMADGWDKESQNIHSVELALVAKGMINTDCTPLLNCYHIANQIYNKYKNTARRTMLLCCPEMTP